MSRDSPRTEYSHEDETARTPYDDDERAAYDDDRTLPGFLPFGWPAAFPGGTTDEIRREEEYDERYDEGYGTDQRRRTEDEGTWLDEGLITLTIVAGVALFLFPEPATSGLGILLITVGVLAWIVDWMM